jgi:non-heme chloroperoxidase
LDLRDAVHIGHSTGGGEVTRYIGRHGTGRVAKAVLVNAILPLMLKSESNPGGMPIEAFDKIRAAVLADRTQFWRDLSMPFYGYNRPGAKISEGVREQFVHQCMLASFPKSYFGIKAWSETDLTEDLKRFDVPTSSKIIPNAQLSIYEGAPHGLPTTHKERLNQDLLAFIKGVS